MHARPRSIPLPHELSGPGRTSNCRRGFTLIEMLVTVGIVAVLASVAYPSLEGQVLRARRSDGLISLMNGHLAQERFRADNTHYGDLAAIGLRPTSAAGYYTLRVTANSADAFAILASANAGQTRDTACRHLRIGSASAALTFASGPDATTANADAANRKCWNL